MLVNFIQCVKKLSVNSKIILALAAVAIIFSIFTYYSITNKSGIRGPDPKQVLRLILIDLIIFLTLGILVARKIIQKSLNKRITQHSFLQNRIIIAFSLVAAVPTVIVAVFSAYIFNFGLQSWFDKKISIVLDQSIIVAESYIQEHTMRLKEAAKSIAEDFSYMSLEIINNPNILGKVLNGQAEMRSLDEAIIFQSATNAVLAQTALSFSLAVTTIPKDLIELVKQGGVVQIKSDPTKIRMLTTLPEYHDTYLLIGKLINSKIIDHIDKTNGAAAEYYNLKRHIADMQIKFSIIFIFIALLLLCAAISWGVVFAGQIVVPITKLVIASEKVKDGDLTVQLSENQSAKDEIMILTKAFNRMVKQIHRQQKDLIIAQRAAAWADVARRVAHEIKNPLTPIQLASDRLLKKFETEVTDKIAFRKYLKTILNHAQDIEKIVIEFVNFARLPAPVFGRFEITSLIKEVLESRRIINEKCTYKFLTNVPKVEFIGDAGQINQIMVNLIKNSEEALENDNKPKITIEMIANKEEVIINVIDNGPGFPPHLMARATEAYVTNRTKGTGLGLAIVKKIVEDHLGVIEIHNLPSRGTNVRLIFNLAELSSKLK